MSDSDSEYSEVENLGEYEENNVENEVLEQPKTSLKDKMNVKKRERSQKQIEATERMLEARRRINEEKRLKKQQEAEAKKQVKKQLRQQTKQIEDEILSKPIKNIEVVKQERPKKEKKQKIVYYSSSSEEEEVVYVKKPKAKVKPVKVKPVKQIKRANYYESESDDDYEEHKYQSYSTYQPNRSIINDSLFI